VRVNEGRGVWRLSS